MLQSLNLKHIYYFWVVAKEESIQKASVILNVSPSSISEQIKILESRVGVDLFDRSQKRMTLGLAGKEIFTELDNFFPKLDEMFESLVNHKHVDVKLVNIGFCPSLSKEVRYKLSFNIIEDPYYTVKIHQGENSYLTKAFNDGDIDLLFTTNAKLGLKGAYKEKKLGVKKFSLVCNNKLAAKIGPVKGVEAVNEQRFINYTPDSDIHFKIQKLFNYKNIHPIRSAEIDDLNLTLQTVLSMNCFAILPDNLVNEKIKNNELTKIRCSLTTLDTPITAFYKPRLNEQRFENHLKCKLT